MHLWAAEFLSRKASFREAIKGVSALAGPRNDSRSPFRVRWRQIAEQFGIASPLLAEWGFDSPVIFEVAPYHLDSNVRLKDAPGKWFLGEDHGWGSALVFDLRMPVAPQIRAAERILKRAARSGVSPIIGAQRDRNADYQVMLRVLDARAANATWSEIGATLFPKKLSKRHKSGKYVVGRVDYVKKLHRKATVLRDGGYRHLAALRRGTLRNPP